MDHFTIHQPDGSALAASMIGIIDSPRSSPPRESWAGQTGDGRTVFGRRLVRALIDGDAQAAADAVAGSGWGMRRDLAWSDHETLADVAEHRSGVVSVISQAGRPVWSGVRVVVRKGIAYLRLGTQTLIFGVSPVESAES